MTEKSNQSSRLRSIAVRWFAPVLFFFSTGRIDAPSPPPLLTCPIVQFHTRPVSSLDLRLFRSGKHEDLRCCVGRRRGWKGRKNGRGDRSPESVEKWRYQRATRSDGLPWNEGLPGPGIGRREVSLRGETGCEVRDYSRDTDSAKIGADPPVTLFQLSIGRLDRRIIAEVCSSRRRLSKLFIVDITFYSRRAAAARRPDGASAVTRDGGCEEQEKKKEKKTDERDTSCMSEFVRLRECETRRAYE